MAPKTDLQDPADGTGEVTLELLREQFQHSFVPRSEDDAGTPILVPRIGRQSKITGAASATPGSMVTPRSMVSPGFMIVP